MQIELEIDYDLLADKVCERLEDKKTLTEENAGKGEKVFGIRGLAKALGCSPCKVQDLKNRGMIPYYNIGKKVYFFLNEVNDALKTEGYGRQ